MGRSRVYSNEQMLGALKETKGMVYLAAARIGCSHETIYARARCTPAVARAIKHERGQVVDTAELKLYSAVLAGEPWAIQLCLKTLGKDRGYVERTEHQAVTDAEIDAEIERELKAVGRNGQGPPARRGAADANREGI